MKYDKCLKKLRAGQKILIYVDNGGHRVFAKEPLDKTYAIATKEVSVIGILNMKTTKSRYDILLGSNDRNIGFWSKDSLVKLYDDRYAAHGIEFSLKEKSNDLDTYNYLYFVDNGVCIAKILP